MMRLGLAVLCNVLSWAIEKFPLAAVLLVQSDRRGVFGAGVGASVACWAGNGVDVVRSVQNSRRGGASRFPEGE